MEIGPRVRILVLKMIWCDLLAGRGEVQCTAVEDEEEVPELGCRTGSGGYHPTMVWYGIKTVFVFDLRLFVTELRFMHVDDIYRPSRV